MQSKAVITARIDPRAARSATALRGAILRLAASQPRDTITVDQIVEAAHVTRKTFYNHVSNPLELLTSALTEELDQVRERMDDELLAGGSDLAALSRARLGEVVDHILQRRQIYQQPDGRIHPQLYRLLSDHFYEGIRFSIRESYRQVPIDRTTTYDSVADIHAGYIAHAYAGAIDTWLPQSEVVPHDTLLDVIIGSLPHWMTTRN